MRKVHGAGNNVWAVGTGGAARHSDGPRTVTGVWAASETEVWVSGAPGLVMKWDGTNWTTLPAVTTYRIATIDGDAAGMRAAGGSPLGAQDYRDEGVVLFIPR